MIINTTQLIEGFNPSIFFIYKLVKREKFLYYIKKPFLR
nr:MAG TPA: hypothetical protein [Caudoviricetes sp.]